MKQEPKMKIVRQDGEMGDDIDKQNYPPQDYPTKESSMGCGACIIALITTLIAMAIIISLIPSDWSRVEIWVIFGLIIPIFIGAVLTLLLYQELNLENLSETLLAILRQMLIILALLWGLVLLGIGTLLGFCAMS